MSLQAELETKRTRLRRWREEDLTPFAALNRDPEVVEFLPKPLTRAESDDFACRIREHFETHGYGLWALEVRETSSFVGFVGFSIPRFETHFTPCVEIGWRLARPAWRRGYATEGARAALQFGFEQAGLDEIVSFSVPLNRRSRRVMEKLGMTRDPDDDFDHPNLPEGHRLRGHVLYRIRDTGWPGVP